MTTDVEKFYTDRKWLLQFTINAINYLPALRELWRKNLGFSQNMKILDVGCGTGALTKTLFEVSQREKAGTIKFFAFDVTQTLLDEFRHWILQKEITDIRTLKADLRYADKRLPSSWNKFDVICSSGVLEYLDTAELFRALESLHDLLTPTGKLIVMGSRRHPINYFLIKLLYKANLYSRKKFVELLKAAGFSKISFWKFPRPYFYLNLWGYIAVAEK